MHVEPLEGRWMLYSGDVLVGGGGSVAEYTLAGKLVKQINVPSNGADGGARDFQVDPSGNIQLWAGTFSPVLERHNGPITGAGGWTSEASTLFTPGWSTINRTFNGGVAAIGQYIFVSDQSTGGGEANGLIRFDAKNSYKSTRFVPGSDFSDVSIGADGKLYAMDEGETIQATVSVFDPNTLKLIRRVNVPGFDNACATGDSAGNIYVGSFSDGKVYKLSSTGKNLGSVDIEGWDIDISSDNQILVSDGSTVRVLDTNLNILHAFTPAGNGPFVAFASYQLPKPPPPPPNTASIAGSVFNDVNSSGGKDTGEAGLRSWKLFIDANKNGMLDSGEKTATTDANGNYKFGNLAAGTYRVREVLNPGWRRTSPASGYFDVTVTSTQAVTGKNFADTQKILVTGTVFGDVNGDKARNAGETGLKGFRVYADLNHNGRFDAGENNVTTDATGVWTFKQLAAGTYDFRIDPQSQSGYTLTTPTGGKFTVTLAAGGSTNNKAFGEKKKPA